MRLTVVVLALCLAGAAAADDDEGLLETPPLGGIPERMEVLEREWDEDVGTKDPEPVAPNGVDPDLVEAGEELKPPVADEPEPAPERDKPALEPAPAKPPAMAPRERPSPPPAKTGERAKPDRRDATAGDE
jgi:hypothetical protein